MGSVARVFDVMEPPKGHLDCGDGIRVPLEESSVSLSIFRRQLEGACPDTPQALASAPALPPCSPHSPG